MVRWTQPWAACCLALFALDACQESAVDPPDIQSLHPDTFYVEEPRREAFVRGSNFLGTVQVQIDSDSPPVLDREFLVRVAGQTLPSADVTFENTENLRIVLPDGLGPGIYPVEVQSPGGLSDRLDNALEIFDGAIHIETTPGGQGSEVLDVRLAPRETLDLYCVTRRPDDSFVRNETCRWELTEPIGELQPAADEQTTFSPTTTGTTRVVANHPWLGSDQTGDIQIACQDDADCADPCYSLSRCDEGACIMGPVDKDEDGDGHLDEACPEGDDCDDGNPGIHPGAPEWCDGVDNDCDPDTPDGSSDPWPQETCDGRDNDCDGLIDPPDSLFCTVYFQDADDDGFGAPEGSRCLCRPGGQHTAVTGDDCDDADPAVHPEAHEGVVSDPACDDGVDNDCDGQTDSPDPCCGTGWWDAAWTSRRKLNIENDSVSEHLLDVPVLVRLDPDRIDYADAGTAGAGVRFVDADCTSVLDHQIEAWVEGDQSLVWVRVPRVARAGFPDHIWMYTGYPGAPDNQNPAGVWSEDYQAVYHLHDDLDDSTANGLSGTNRGSLDGPGAIGRGQAFDGASSHIDLGTDLGLLQGVPGATLSVWFQADSVSAATLIGLSVGNTEDSVFSRASIALVETADLVAYGRSADSDPMQDVRTDSGLLDTGTWHHATATFDYAYSCMGLFLDGSELLTREVNFSLPATSPSPTHNNTIGAQDDASEGFFAGNLDEVRIAKSLRSAAWIAAQYLSMTDQLLAFGDEEAY